MLPNFRRIDVAKLYPPFVERLERALNACNAKGRCYVATLGYRTFHEQAALYFQGRTMKGPKVTDAGPGYSPHQYGLACDFVLMLGGKCDWAAKDYALLGVEAERVGLVWGGRFKHTDADHIQWPGRVTKEELEPLRRTYLANSAAPLPTVWATLA